MLKRACSIDGYRAEGSPMRVEEVVAEDGPARMSHLPNGFEKAAAQAMR